MTLLATSIFPNWTLVNTGLAIWFATLLVIGFFMNISITCKLAFGGYTYYKFDQSLILATSFMGLLHVIFTLALGMAYVALESPCFLFSALVDSVISMVRLGAFFLILIIACYRYLRVCQFKSDDLNSFTASRLVFSFICLYLIETIGAGFNGWLKSEDVSSFWQEAFGLLCYLYSNLFCVIVLLMIATCHVIVPLTNESTASSTDESQQLLDPKVVATNRKNSDCFFDLSPDFVVNYSSISQLSGQIVHMKVVLNRIRDIAQFMIVMLVFVYVTWAVSHKARGGDYLLAQICQFFDNCNIFMLYHVHILLPYYLYRKPSK